MSPLQSPFEMKYLTVIRHAKSSWDQPGLADHDRPLNERGRKAAPAMGRFLWTTYFGGEGAEPLLPQPQRLMSSDALRSLSTAQILREQFQMEAEQLVISRSLYLAPEGVILGAVQKLEDSFAHVALVGHNPGLHDFVNRVLARAKVPRFPTCATALIALPIEFWSLADWNEAQLVGFITPRLLEKRFPETYQGISEQDSGGID